MDLFDNGEPEEFLLFVRNFNMTLAASGTLAKSAQVNYSRTLVHGEVLRQFYLLSDDVEGKNPLAVENSSYFSYEFAIESKKRDAPQNEESTRV